MDREQGPSEKIGAELHYGGTSGGCGVVLMWIKVLDVLTDQVQCWRVEDCSTTPYVAQH